MSLTVALHRAVSGEDERTVGEPITVSLDDQGDEDSYIFNTVPGQTKIEFGCDRKLANELGLATNKFLGTIGEFTIDQQTLPLWAFTRGNQECEGDFPAPLKPSNGYMFRNGFAQIRLPLSDRPSATQVSVIFSAYSPNGLLYFRGNQRDGHFICIELNDGHVVLKMNFGDDLFVKLESKKSSYNDGRTHTIRAIRNNQQIHLQVDNESDRTTDAIENGKAILNVNNADHFVSGIPPGFNISMFRSFDIQWSGFFGCIQSVKPSQVAELDLDNPIRSQYKFQGCSFKDGERLEPTDRIVGFSQPGFLITQGIRFSDNSTLGFAFRTRSPNATLLFQSSKLIGLRRRREINDENSMGYIAFYLYRGFLVVHLGTDPSHRSKVLTLRSEIIYNDGQFHSVLLSRQETLVRLRVDDYEIASGTLADQATIGSHSSELFIGGFPEKRRPSANEMPIAEALIGCVTNIFIDYRLVPIIPEAHLATIGACPAEYLFSASKEPSGATAHTSKIMPSDRWTDTALDHAILETKPTHVPEPRKQQYPGILGRSVINTVDHTTAISAQIGKHKMCGPAMKRYGESHGAARFGISETSHSRLNFEGHYPNINQFTIEFTFRTAQHNGMLWVWANYKNYSRYFLLSLIDGHLQLEVKGHKQPKILKYESAVLNDNKWHDLRLVKHEREMTLQVDANLEQTMNDAPNPKVMRKRMYVGGVISKHRRQFKLFSTPQFSGCIRDFIVDDQQRDLFVTSRDIIPCSAMSRATYVHDGGYATFDALKSIGAQNEIEISLYLHPIIETGLIFGLMTNQDAKHTRITVSLKNGLLTFELILDEERRELKHILEKNLCDGKWHNVSVKITSAHINIGLDKHVERLPTKTSIESIGLFRSLPIFVGGVPSQMSKHITVPSLIGCFRHLHLGTKPVSFRKTKKSNKIVPNSCPFTNGSRR